jgi:hypothetical protein
MIPPGTIPQTIIFSNHLYKSRPTHQGLPHRHQRHGASRSHSPPGAGCHWRLVRQWLPSAGLTTARGQATAFLPRTHRNTRNASPTATQNARTTTAIAMRGNAVLPRKSDPTASARTYASQSTPTKVQDAAGRASITASMVRPVDCGSANAIVASHIGSVADHPRPPEAGPRNRTPDRPL